MRKNKYILEMNYSKLIEIHIIDLGCIFIYIYTLYKGY